MFNITGAINFLETQSQHAASQIKGSPPELATHYATLAELYLVLAGAARILAGVPPDDAHEPDDWGTAPLTSGEIAASEPKP